MTDENEPIDIAEFRARQIEQGELWPGINLDGHWHHVTRGMVFKGMLAEIGATPWFVYTAIKAHTNLHSGKAMPSVARLSELLGLSHDTVQRAIKHLEKLGHLIANREGKVNNYQIVEKFPLTTATGESFGLSESPYIPNTMQQVIRELQDFAKTGNLPKGQGITINVTFNVQNINQGDNGVVNVQNVSVAGSENNKELSDMALRMSKLKSL